MTDTIRVWRRSEIEEAAAEEPEGRTMLRCLISPRMLLMLIEYQEAKGSDRIEMLSAYGDPLGCELRFFKSDVAKGSRTA